MNSVVIPRAEKNLFGYLGMTCSARRFEHVPK